MESTLTYYKNKSQRHQVINLNTGRALFIDSGEEQVLKDGEDQSIELQMKLRARPPLGVVRQVQVPDSTSSKRKSETTKRHSTKKETGPGRPRK